MSVRDRKVMVVYKDGLLPDGCQGVCECGHEFELNERFVGYPAGDGTHWFTCLTCHFWKVHDQKAQA